MTIEKHTLAILAGGKNSRFKGMNKAFLKINGDTIINRTIQLLSDLFNEIIIITNQPQDFDKFHQFNIFGDIYKDQGPLGGIHSALTNSLFPSVFVVSCDMPFLNHEFIKKMVNLSCNINSDAIVPLLNSQPEPTHSIYHKRIIPVIEKHLIASVNPSIRQIYNDIDIQFIKLDNNNDNKLIFTNVNSPDIYKLIYINTK